MVSTSQFQVHTPLVAMKSNGKNEKYITLRVGTVGEIIELNHPSYVIIRVHGEMRWTPLFGQNSGRP